MSGGAEECFLRGRKYETGDGVAQNYATAVEWYRKASDKGHAVGQNNLGWCYENGKGVTQSFSEAAKWYRKSADQGNALRQNNLGACYQDGQGVAKDLAQAVKWYRMSANQGNMLGQFNLGRCYENGLGGLTKDLSLALDLYQKAAAQGQKEAELGISRVQAAVAAEECFQRGRKHEMGEGAAQDYAVAAKWYRQAADKGHAVGQNNLGWYYENGKGVTQSFSEAAKWYRKSADQGNALGQNNLGACYQDGQGVAKDLVQAVKWYRMSANQGNMLGQFNLGRCYENGLGGLTKDLSLALDLYQKAAAQGQKEAKLAVERVQPKGVEAEARRRREEDIAHEREKLELHRQRTAEEERALRVRLELEHEAKAKELSLLAERLKLEKQLADLKTAQPTAQAASPGNPGGLSSHGAYEILPNNLEKGKYLGSGAFREVFDGLYQKHTRVAMKLVKIAGSPRQLERKRADFEQEMAVWGTLPYHDNVQPLIGWCKEPFCMVTRFMANGTAADYLAAKRWDPAVVVDVLFQIAKGMNHLHSRPMPILHSDLKGANVLVDENGVAKVADFGLSKIRSGSTRQTMFVGGTPYYMAPEVWDGRRGRPSDVYAFGMMMWEFLSEGDTPLEQEMMDEDIGSAQRLGERIKADPDFRPQRPDRCPEALWALMRRCWDFDAAKRPTFGQVADELKAIIDRKDSALAV